MALPVSVYGVLADWVSEQAAEAALDSEID